MIVDSAVWIDLLSRKSGRAWPLLRRALADRLRVFVIPAIVQEVVQGARDEAEFKALKTIMEGIPTLEGASGIASALAAAGLYARCRWQGVTIRSPNDCLIAMMAVEYGEPLLTDDRDFIAIRTIEPRLKLIDIPRSD